MTIPRLDELPPRLRHFSVVGLDRQGQEGSFRIASFYFYRNTRWLQRAAKKRTFGPREETAAEDYDDFSHVNVANSRIPRIHTLRDLNGERRARSGLGSSELTHRQFMLIELAGSPERYAVPKSTAPRFDGLSLRPRPRASDADAVSGL